MKLFIFLGIILLTSCGSQKPLIVYDGPERKDEEVSKIVGTFDSSHTVLNASNMHILISCVDGKSTDNPWALSSVRFPNVVVVTPGVHNIGVFITSGPLTYLYGEVTFESLPNQTYQIQQASYGQNVYVMNNDLKVPLLQSNNKCSKKPL